VDLSVVGYISVGIGIFFLWHYRKSREALQLSAQWPGVQGQVLKSEVKRSGRRKATYESSIHYSYAMAGQEFVGKRITLGGDVQGGRQRAQRRCDQYPEGREVMVYVNPDNPKQACVERTREGYWMEILGGIFAIALGVAMIFGVLPAE